MTKSSRILNDLFLFRTRLSGPRPPHSFPQFRTKLGARKFGGDPAATDSTRVLRLPGFVNQNYEAEFRVRAQSQSDRIYHLQDFRLRTETIDNEFRMPHRTQTSGSSGARFLSQSEHDWAYAKRALSRGDDPEEVIRRIAQFRGGEKSNPLYYAQLTVNKARLELSQPNARPDNGTVSNETPRSPASSLEQSAERE